MATVQATLSQEQIKRTFAGLEIQKVSEVASGWGQCWGLYGKPGSGKTTLAATAAGKDPDHPNPYGAPLVFFECEAGTNVLEHRTDIDRIPMSSWNDMRKFAAACEQEDIPWKTIVLDNYCEMGEHEMRVRAPIGTVAEIKDYNLNTQAMLANARFWRDLSRKKGVNVFFVFWDETEKSEQGRWETKLLLSNKLATKLPGILDTLGYLEVEDNTEERILRLAPNSRMATKFRRAPTSEAMKIPSIIYKPDLGEILDVLKGGKSWDVAKHTKQGVKQENKE